MVEVLRRYSRLPHLWQITRRLEKLLDRDTPKHPDSDVSDNIPWRISTRVQQEALDKLAADYRGGDSVEVLQERYRLGRATVLRLLDEAGVQKRMQGMSAEQVQRAQELYTQSLSIREVAAELGVPKTTVQNALVRAGQVMRPARRVRRR